MVKIINLTPHDINFVGATIDGDIVFPSAGIARAEEITEQLDAIWDGYNRFPVVKKKFGRVSNLPEQQKNTFYIVSVIVANALPERSDLLIVSETVRNEKGQIMGCKSFAHV